MTGPTAVSGLARRRSYATVVDKASGIDRVRRVDGLRYRIVSRWASRAGDRDIQGMEEDREENGPTDGATRQ